LTFLACGFMILYWKRVCLFRVSFVESEVLSMAVNPTQNLQMFPIAKTNQSLGKSPYTTALQRHHGDEDAKDPSDGLARPAERPIRLEKGSVVDIYV